MKVSIIYSWDDVKHWVYAGSPVDVPHFTRKGGAWVVGSFDEDGETYLLLSDGSEINARDYLSPLGWTMPTMKESP